MYRAQLVNAIAEQADISKGHAEKALSAFLDTVTYELKRGGAVSLTGFGQFTTKVTQPRTGRNPKTGETIQIPASRRPAFKPGKALKDAVKQP